MTDGDVLNDELERVYGLYGERSKQFRRNLYVLIIAALVIFALIVVPFLTFRDQIARLQHREAELVVEIQEARVALAARRADLEALEEMRSRFIEFSDRYRSFEHMDSMRQSAAEHGEELDELQQSFVKSRDEGLRNWALGRAERPPEEAVQSIRRLAAVDWRPCYWDRGMAHIACQVCEDLSEINANLTNRISRLPSLGETRRQPAINDLDQLVARTCAWLNGEEPHWRSEQRISDDVSSLRGDLSLDLRQYLEELAQLEDVVRSDLPERELQVERLERARSDVTEQLTVFERQLERVASFDRIGTPIGDLPIGLGQLVLLFPVAVALGFVLVANGYAQVARLQRAFVRLCRMRDQSGTVIDDQHLSAIAPLWLEPREPVAARAAKWFIMLLPLMLIAVDLWLIARTQALTVQLPDDAAISSGAFVVLYAISTALVLGALWHVWRYSSGPHLRFSRDAEVRRRH